jgi:hypothetical protein
MADLLGSHDVWLERSCVRLGADSAYGLLTRPCTRPHVERALGALADATGCEVFAIRTLD